MGSVFGNNKDKAKGADPKQGGSQPVVAEPVNIGREAKAPFAMLPVPQSLFEARAERFRHLAKTSPMADYLSFMGALAEAQLKALDGLQPQKVPGEREMSFFREHQMAALDRTRWPRDAAWISALRAVLEHMARIENLPNEAQQVIKRLSRMQDAGLNDLADRVLRDLVDGSEQGEALFIVAALQVYWTALAALMDAEQIVPNEAVVTCPVCASPPVASVVHEGGNLHKARYLCCSLCGTRWNYVRIKCVQCQSTKGIAYHAIEGTDGAVKAETCDECKTYTKALYEEKDPGVEPFADDLATLGLDVLVGEAGWQRANPNPFLLPDQPHD